MYSFDGPDQGHLQTGPRPPAAPWWRGRYGFALFHGLSLFVLFELMRVILYVVFGPKDPMPAWDVARTFLIGAYLDVFVALLLTLPMIGWFWILREHWFSSRAHRIFFCGVLGLFWAVQVFLSFAEFYFFEEFRSRFNTVAVDYLLYPHEVFINIWDSYPVVPVVILCLMVAAGWMALAHRLFQPMWTLPVRALTRFGVLVGGIAVAAVMFFPVDFKFTRFSSERLLNELSSNGAVSFFTAAWTHHLDYAAFYRTLPMDEAYQRTRRLLDEPYSEFVEEGRSIRRRIKGDPTRPRLNVVILLEESLGSEFWGTLGRKGESLTPEMDKLAQEEGMLFTNLYATGNRTVRGFEGVLSSFPPLPGDSIVKRHLSQNVESLARVLKRDGYQTAFIYGGRGIFDGMRAYALANGYDKFVEQKHFDKVTFATIWGVCDEDIFDRTIEECRQMAATGKPFHAVALTVSNHKPYTYPKGRIPEDPEARKRAHAVKYSDYALGRFFRMVKQEPFYTNTIFVVVADHGARVYGSQSIPIHSYEIPLLIVGPAVVKKPQRIPTLGCSLDVAPTILGLIGRPYETMFFGRDLLRGRPENARVLLNHNRDIGMYVDQHLIVLGLQKTVEYFHGDPKQDTLKLVRDPTPKDLELEKDAIALFQVADDLYMNQRYRIDPQ